MPLSRTLAIGLTGLDGHPVEVQCDISAGLPGLYFTGRADPSVVESRDRMRAAMHNCGLDWPNRRVTLALLPADSRKVGSRYDLAMCLAVLAASEVISPSAVRDAVWIAELGLDGGLRPVRGVLPSVLAAQRSGVSRVVVARANAAEAALVDGVDVRAADDLGQVVGWLTGKAEPLDRVTRADPGEARAAPGRLDLVDVAGQSLAKKSLEYAAAGGHHLYLVGPPGAGKTMLAERLPGLLPALDDVAALETTAIHSIAGMLPGEAGLIRRPPLQAPHHSATLASLVGGGSGLARPGAISLAHNGVLFLDEAAEFARPALDALRQPLESGRVVLHRGGGAVGYPSRFQLVLAANPCGCALVRNECSCTPMVRRRHEQRLSGPLMDRVDLRVEVDAVAHTELLDALEPPDTTEAVARRVLVARATAAERLRDVGLRLNAEVPGRLLRRGRLAVPRAVIAPVEEYLEQGRLSARGFDRTLRLAWTIADLGGHTVPTPEDVGEALFFRVGKAQSWAA